jgi:hypothetical protein
MEWITNNWFLLLIAALFIGMHFFGYGCGAHGKHGKHSEEESDHHKGHTDAGSLDGSTTKKGHSCCH